MLLSKTWLVKNPSFENPLFLLFYAEPTAVTVNLILRADESRKLAYYDPVGNSTGTDKHRLWHMSGAEIGN